MRFIFKHLKVSWLVLLGLLLAVLFFYPDSNYRKEDLQSFFYPLFLLIVWKLPKNTARSIPRVFILIAMFCWAVSALNIRGRLPNLFSKNNIYISKLDDGHLKTKEIYKKYNKISRSYSLPTIEYVHRYFTSNQTIHHWLDAYLSRTYLLHGSSRTLELALNSNVNSLYRLDPKNTTSRNLLELANDYDLNQNKDFVSYHIPDLNLTFALAGAPRSFYLTGAREDLNLHFLSWISKGLKSRPEVYFASQLEAKKRKVKLAEVKDAYDVSSQFLGPWLSTSQTGLAHFFSGTIDLLGTMIDRVLDRTISECVIPSYERAASLAFQNSDPEIYSVIFNNAAIAQLATADDDSDFKQAWDWFWMSAKTTDLSGKPVHAAKLAMINLLILDRARGLAYE